MTNRYRSRVWEDGGSNMGVTGVDSRERGRDERARVKMWDGGLNRVNEAAVAQPCLDEAAPKHWHV